MIAALLAFSGGLLGMLALLFAIGAVVQNKILDDSDSVRQNIQIVYGRGNLAAGVLNEDLAGFDNTSVFLVSYDNNAAYNDAVAGRLLCSYNAGINRLTITSTNGADVNSVRWVAMR